MSLQAELKLAMFIMVAVLVGWGVSLFTHIKLTLLFLLVLLALKFRRKIYVVLVTLPRDIRFAYRFAKVALSMQCFRRDNTTILELFSQRVSKDPNKACFIFEGTTWTYSQVEKLSNQVAHVFLAAGYEKGDVVALYMGNRPEYVCIWLGLAKIGVVTALINTNLQSQPLLHSLMVAQVKGVIFSQELGQAVVELNLEHVDHYQFGEGYRGNGRVKLLDKLLESVPASPLKVPAPQYRDKLLYIYTSGTTGLPKAAIILHSRYLLATMAAVHALALRRDDVMYNPLPLYHMAGGVVGTGPSLAVGITCVLRSKFSASSFWSDCIKYNCTVAQYIGEMCRYLLATPAKPEDCTHKVRMMVGNGMRPNIWKDFVGRFKVKQVCELYGATEGNTNIVNVDNTIGAVGFLPSILPLSLLPMALIRINKETGEPVRNENGFCIRCDVGDILVMDEFGYLYFKDRTGDNFRWKGENVATTEVEAVITSVVQVKDVAVYGVQVPGTEGRAGMVAIVDPDGTLNLKALAEGVNTNLPAYARPVFVRVMKEIELTGTYKIKKTMLQKDGFDPSLIKDDLYLYKGTHYIPLTPEIYSGILSGAVRV
ncbi:long-chain fatty acid transport protein 4 isoform X2 [Anabrus simplex]|uniref:long-chain fatty acid transport protein 4 isoform X2 n=1 Tax=Anabrus simplex TaxID=316456 RepID=UPI0035A2EA33